MSQRLVLFVEGPGDAEAAPVLVRRFLTEQAAWQHIFLDEDAFRIGELPALFKNDFEKWRRLLRAASKRNNMRSVLAILDGDCERLFGQPFCAASAARQLAEAGRAVGAGSTFSLAVVIACCEFESWLIAGVESLVGKSLPDGRIPIPQAPDKLPENVELGPRGAKGWLGRAMEGGYSATRDQAALTTLLDVQMVRDRGVRSFRRLESAVQGIVSAAIGGAHLVSPC